MGVEAEEQFLTTPTCQTVFDTHTYLPLLFLIHVIADTMQNILKIKKHTFFAPQSASD